jgi:hypothetical protein
MHLSLRKLSVTATAAVAAGLAMAAPSGAGSSIAVAGNIVPTGGTLSQRAADGNILVDAVGRHTWTGGFAGTSTVEVHFVIHPNGQVIYQGLITFTGSTPCGTGTIRLEDQGSGTFPGPLPGKFTTIDQGNSTVAIRVNGSNDLFLGPAGASGTYTGEVTCA